jgi:hypothetical protein
MGPFQDCTTSLSLFCILHLVVAALFSVIQIDWRVVIPDGACKRHFDIGQVNISSFPKVLCPVWLEVDKDLTAGSLILLFMWTE